MAKLLSAAFLKEWDWSKGFAQTRPRRRSQPERCKEGIDESDSDLGEVSDDDED